MSFVAPDMPSILPAALLPRYASAVAIRYAQPDDAAVLSCLLAEPSVSRWLADVPFASPTRIHKYLSNICEGRHVLVPRSPTRWRGC